MDEDEYIPLSALNQYSYCPRRCYLIHADGVFVENVHTIKGANEHERIDGLHGASKPGIRIEFALPVWSQKLGLIGKCDVVEFHDDGTIYPVEYKHGKRARWLNDDLQLGAQALCLEEMLGTDIPKGAIYHQQSRRRREVLIDEPLRNEIAAAAAGIRRILAQRNPPQWLVDQKRCRECSLASACEPGLDRSTDTHAVLRAELFEP